MIEIRLDALRGRKRTRIAVSRAPAGVSNDRLDMPLDVFGELLPSSGEDLDAVVFEWVVRRGDDDAEVVAGCARQIRDSRSRHDTSADDGGAFGGRPMRELRFNPRTRFAGVTADENPGRRRPVRQRAHDGPAEPANGGVIKRILAGFAADPVGPEQPLSF